MPKFASIDYEFYDTAESKLRLVCASVRHDGDTYDYWLHNYPIETQWLIGKIKELKEQGYTFLAYNVVAEARAFLSLGLDPLDFDWVDLYLEYRCLSNHNNRYAYGKQLIKGKKKFTKPPKKSKWEMTEQEQIKVDNSKQEYGYGAAAYKVLGEEIDNDFKKEIRDIIIKCNSGDRADIDAMVARKDEIMGYCASDVIHLEPMWKEMQNEYKRLLGRFFDADTLRSDVRTRANYACRTAIMESVGYPINVANTRNFSNQVGNILWECQTDINKQFEGENFRPFRATVKSRPLELSWNQVATRDRVAQWCRGAGYKGWTLTDSGALSLSLKAFSKPVSYRHKYPTGNFIAQMQRYLKLKQGLNGFSTTGKSKNNFWDSVGRDGRVRPYMGIYGAQSSRSQPSATGFIPLKAAWMRSLIEPGLGRAICGIDFASQEFLLAALLSGDERMLAAYESGDVYLAFGKAIGYIPKDGTKQSHKKERDDCKAVVLGLSYDMSKYGLATDLSEKFGRRVSTDEAQRWISKHKRAYPKFWRWKDYIQKLYRTRKHLRLADGWYLWGDNSNFRSVGNVPVQGMGACIMRKAVELAQEAGLDVIFTLHDAIYIEFNFNELDRVQCLASCMDKAFRFYFGDNNKSKATVRLDADVWGPEFHADGNKFVVNYYTDYGMMNMPVKQQQIYIDERGAEEYKKFKKYFNKPDFEEVEF